MSFRFRHGDRLLDGYTIQRGVGRGAFGEVYYAISDGGREVALKAILQNQDIELRGIQHCINLKSPHLVSIFDVRKSEDGTPVVIMEYVAGSSLRDLLHEHPNGLGTQRAAYFLREIAKGLTYLHDRGIVHRDLKPENLFFEDGYVKICDYGLSKHVGVSHQSGQTMSVGTVHYMAPEIGSGIYNQSIDIYALGVILHELLTGTVPFTGASFGEILMKHLTAEPDLSALEEPFRSVVSRALEKKPEERYEKVEEMARELFQSTDITKSVHLFNPESLTVAARRKAPQPTGPTVSPGAETTPLGKPSADAPPPLPGAQGPGPAQTARVPSGWPPRSPSDATASPEADAPGALPPPWKRPRPEETTAASPTTATPGEPRARPSPERKSVTFQKLVDRFGTRLGASPSRKPTPPAGPFKAPTEEPERLDPLDDSQRLARAAFTILASAVGVTCLDPLTPPPLVFFVGFLILTLSSTVAVISTETFLAKRYKIAEGLPRRLCIGALALLPLGASASLLRLGSSWDVVVTATLLSIVLVDWSRRLDPTREERFIWGEALTAGLLAFILGLAFEWGDWDAFVGAIAIATVSLAVNAYAPFVPHDSRRQGWRGVRDIGEREGPTTSDEAAVGDTWREDRESLREHGSAARRSDDAWSRIGRPTGRAIHDLPPRPPGHIGRVFWLFVGAICLAGGLCCLIIPSTVEVPHPEERLMYSCAFLGSMGLLGFCLYRALWVRRASFWGRNVRPFLLTALGTLSATSGYLVVMGPTEGAWRLTGEETVISIFMSLGALAVLLVLLSIERILKSDERTLRHTFHLPRPERPVNALVSLAQLLVATSSGALTLGLLIVALFFHTDNGANWDLAAMLGGAVAAGVSGIFFAHQALRYRRGHVWESTLRPLLLAASTATIGICSVFLVLRPVTRVSSSYTYGPGGHRLEQGLDHYSPFHDDWVVLCVVLSVICAVFGTFAFFVRGPGRELSRSRLFWWHTAPGQPRDHEASGSGWSGVGTLLWTVSLVLAIASTAMRCGLGSALAGEVKLGAGFDALNALGDSSWLLLGGSILASLCVLLGRRDDGAMHVTRALLGQVCLIATGAILLEIGDLLNVSIIAGRAVFDGEGSPGRLMFLLNTTVVVGLVGAMCLVWPRQSTPDLDNTDTGPDSETNADIGSAREE